MIEELFGKPFRWAFFFLVVLFLATFFAYVFHAGWVLIACAMVLTMIATYQKTEYGLGIAFVELLSNAHGVLATTDVYGFPFSLRMAIFCGVFLGWFFSFLIKKIHLINSWKTLWPFFPLFLAILLGTVVGLFREEVRMVFQDMNAYLFLGYLFPILSIQWDSIKQRVILQVLAAGACFTSLVSLILLFAYTHLSESLLRPLYIFLRDIRFAEITNTGFGFYRIFAQTQLFVILMGLFFFAHLFLQQTKQDRRVTIFGFSLSLATVLMSLSRSFWIGMIVAMGLVILMHVAQKMSWRTIRNATLSFLLALFSSAAILSVVSFFPWPRQTIPPDVFELFESRLNGEDVGTRSRWNLLTPMREQILEAPLMGNGFGQSISFQTDDPRARAVHPDGTWTTRSMEWGWLELWLKMGMFGPLGFLFLGIVVCRGAGNYFQTPKAWTGMWLVSSLTFLFITHIFSPYLNHPIGLGFLMLFWVFLPSGSRVGLKLWSRTPHRILSEVKFQTATCVHEGCPRK